MQRVLPMQPSDPDREAIRTLFLREGFDHVGFCNASPVPDTITPWVHAGHHASLEWMEREPASRTDPKLLLAGARTVICVAAAYPATDARGAVAGYARGEDYHQTLPAALQRAVQKMTAQYPEAVTKVCVDTAPLLERSFAARAGLGWIGRNTMLLNEHHGPWQLLGEVITTLKIEPDEPAADRCGTCTACVDACPTEALGPDRALDARRCLSYWTIEHRGDLPPEWAERLEHRAFGCDDCLTACPFPADSPAKEKASCSSDHSPEKVAEPPFSPRPDLTEITLDQLEQRARESFRRHYGSTPLERARRGGLLRNIAACRATPRQDL
jgi:epoxyqueuosine reductase